MGCCQQKKKKKLVNDGNKKQTEKNLPYTVILDRILFFLFCLSHHESIVDDDFIFDFIVFDNLMMMSVCLDLS